jgi:hypothetical protein
MHAFNEAIWNRFVISKRALRRLNGEKRCHNEKKFHRLAVFRPRFSRNCVEGDKTPKKSETKTPADCS